MKRYLAALFLPMLACGLPASFNPTPAPVPDAIAVPTESPPATQININQLQNAQYQLGIREDHAVVQLKDGKYQQGLDATSFDFAYIALTQFTSAGDLDHDGVDELAAIFLENYGGTGNFGLLTVYVNVDGEPAFLTSTLIDDRPMINAMRIETGEIFLDAVIHGFEDGGCCPQLQTTQRYALVQNQLRLMHFTTLAPNGLERKISIEQPSSGSEVSASFSLSGSVSIAPFENNLSYFIFSEAGEQLAAGPVPVTAADFGAPGTFNITIPLDGLPSGANIIIEVHDQNAANGSLFALDAVQLTVR